MIKISSDFSKDKKIEKRKSSSSPSRTGSVSGSSFQSTLIAEIDGDFDSLMNDLKDRERRFLDSQSYSDLIKYKQTLQQMLKLIMDEGFESQTIQRRRRDRADFLIIKQINDKVELISKNLASKENKAFNLLKEIEEIRGLILDLVH